MNANTAASESRTNISQSAVQQAMAIYARETGPRSFEQDVALHLGHPDGQVFKSPGLFYLARPVCYHDHEEARTAMVDPSVIFPREVWNCWHIYLLAGSLVRTAAHFPFPMELISWERNNHLRVYPFCRLLRHLTYYE